MFDDNWYFCKKKLKIEESITVGEPQPAPQHGKSPRFYPFLEALPDEGSLCHQLTCISTQYSHVCITDDNEWKYEKIFQNCEIW